MKIAVLSDPHSVALSFERAMEEAEHEGFDKLVILGALLTYGVEPGRTLELVQDAVDRHDAALILGNHDQLYIDLETGDCPYYDRLRDWTRESVDWTRERIPAGAFSELPWQQSWSSGKFFTAHANPYSYGDWTYLRTEQELRWAGRILAKRQFKWGVFGHTHRVARYRDREAGVFTVGSLGQPRDRHDRRLQWAMVTFDENSIEVQPRPVEFDVKAHLAAIDVTTLSPTTKQRLGEFFR